MCDNIVKEKVMKKKIILTTVLSVIVCILAGTTCFAAESSDLKPVDNMGDILFYILAAALVVAVIAICVIFSYSKKFVIRERERLIEQKKDYVPAKEIRISDKMESVEESAKEKTDGKTNMK